MTFRASLPIWGTIGFVLVASAAAMSTEDFSIFFIFMSASMAALAFYVCGDRPNSDAFEPIKLASALYALSLGLTPLLYVSEAGPSIPSSVNHLISDRWDHAITIALFGEIAMIAGYFALGGTRHILRPATQVARRTFSRRGTVGIAFVLGLIGIASYVTLVIAAGGFAHLLHYTGSRVRIFGEGFGGWYWGCFFLLSAYCLYAASSIRNRGLITIALGLVLSFMLLLFQGRSLAIAPIFCLILIYSYEVSSIKGPHLGGLIAGGLVSAAFLGFLREADKNVAYSDVLAFLNYFFENFGEYFTLTILRNIEQLDVVFLAVSYIEGGGKFLGGVTLLQWLEPIDRLLFLDRALPSVHIGNFLLNKQLGQTGSEGALSPSLTGEMYTNGGVFAVVLGLFIYGMFIRYIYRPLESGKATSLHLALYSYVLWVSITSLVDGSVSWFKAFTFAAPLIVARYVLPFTQASPPKRRL